MAKLTTPIPQDKIGESFVWRDWFQRLSDKVFGTMAQQDASSVAITGGSISGIDLNGNNISNAHITNSFIESTTIGLNNPAAGSFTSVVLGTPLAVSYGGTGVKTATANYVFAGPTSGSAAAPSFRALVTSDIPALTSGTSILYGNGSGGFSNVAIGSGISFAGGTLSASGSGGTVTAVSVTSANGFAGTSSGGTTPALTLSTSITGLVYANGTALAATTVSSPLSYSAGTLSIPVATSGANGYLSSTDWSTFNGRQVAYTNLTSIGALANATGWLYNNGSGTFSYSTPTATNVGLGNVTNDTQTKAAVVPNTAPSAGQLLIGNAGSTAYAPLSMSGDATIASTGAITVSKFGGTAFGTAAGYAASAFQAAGTYVTSVTGTAPVVSSGGTTPAISMAAASTSVSGYLTSTDWNTFNGKQASGTYVTSLTVTSANGFAGSFTSGATPALTISTSITGLLKGNGTAISAAVANTDYVPLSTVLTKTADYTIANTDTWIINNKASTALTLTFPAASSWTGRSITVKNMQALAVNSATSNVVPIDSTSAGTAILLGVVGNWATLVSDGTNWVIMQAASNNNLLLE